MTGELSHERTNHHEEVIMPDDTAIKVEAHAFADDLREMAKAIEHALDWFDMNAGETRFMLRGKDDSEPALNPEAIRAAVDLVDLGDEDDAQRCLNGAAVMVVFDTMAHVFDGLAALRRDAELWRMYTRDLEAWEQAAAEGGTLSGGPGQGTEFRPTKY